MQGAKFSASTNQTFQKFRPDKFDLIQGPILAKRYFRGSATWWEMVVNSSKWWKILGYGEKQWVGKWWEKVGNGGKWWEIIEISGKWWNIV